MEERHLQDVYEVVFNSSGKIVPKKLNEAETNQRNQVGITNTKRARRGRGGRGGGGMMKMMAFSGRGRDRGRGKGASKKLKMKRQTQDRAPQSRRRSIAMSRSMNSSASSSSEVSNSMCSEDECMSESESMARSICASVIMMKENNPFDIEFDDLSCEENIRAPREIRHLQNNILDKKRKAKEYRETHYYYNQQYYFEPSLFWLRRIEDLLDPQNTSNALRMDGTFVLANTSFTEALFAMAISGLKQGENGPDYKMSGSQVEIALLQPAVIFYKELKISNNTPLDLELIISQRFIDPKDPYIYQEDGSKTIKRIKMFIVGKIYNCKISITNTSESSLDIDILHEIPYNSMPVAVDIETNTKNLNIPPLTTKEISYFFYFPVSCDFGIFPATVIKDHSFVQCAVVDESIPVGHVTKELESEAETFKDAISSKNRNVIINYLKKANLSNKRDINLRLLNPFLKEYDFFKNIVAILKENLYYDKEIWSYSVYHADLEIFKELFCESGTNISLNHTFNEDIVFDYLHYTPIIDQRTFGVGKNEEKSRNLELNKSYMALLVYLIRKKELNNTDKIQLSCYLILLEKLELAQKMFSNISYSDGEDQSVQYLYLKMYLSLHIDYPSFQAIKSVEVNPSLYYGVWRRRLEAIKKVVSDYEEEQARTQEIPKVQQDKISDSDAKTTVQYKGSKKETIKAQFSKESQTSVNLSTNYEGKLTIKYFKIHLELLYSMDPFMTQNKNIFHYIEPTFTENLEIGASSKTKDGLYEVTYEIQKSLQDENMIVAFMGSNANAKLNYINSNLSVEIFDSQGVLKVKGLEGRGLPKAYVKVFAMMKGGGGGSKFYKDGFTNLLGVFDYFSLNVDNFDNQIESFAIFVKSEGSNSGSFIGTCPAPLIL